MLAIIPAAFRRPGLSGQGPFLRRLKRHRFASWALTSGAVKILLRDAPFGAVLCLVGTNYINSANAQQTDQQTIVTKAEAALAAKIKCEDFRKNTNGTWTSAPNTKIGDSAFPQHTFDIREVSIGGADLATVLNRKCGGTPPVR
jgi:hypothetical protein